MERFKYGKLSWYNMVHTYFNLEDEIVQASLDSLTSLPKRPVVVGGLAVQLHGACLKKLFRNKRVLVTGDTGFKGSWLGLWLNEQAYAACADLGANADRACSRSAVGAAR